MIKTDLNNEIVTEHLRRIGIEETIEFIEADGTTTTITKAEALARNLWNMALGWSVEVPIYDDNDELASHKTVVYPPDKRMAKQLFELLEGKPGVKKVSEAGPKKGRRAPASVRVDEQLALRLNKDLLKETDNGYGTEAASSGEAEENKARPKIPLPKLPRKRQVQTNRTANTEGPS